MTCCSATVAAVRSRRPGRGLGGVPYLRCSSLDLLRLEAAGRPARARDEGSDEDLPRSVGDARDAISVEYQPTRIRAQGLLGQTTGFDLPTVCISGWRRSRWF